MNDWIDALQWPAMAVTVLAAWFVAANSKRKRSAGFWLFLLSNALWIVWALPSHAYALAVLQVSLAIMNIRGVVKADPEADKSGQSAKSAKSDKSDKSGPAKEADD